MISIILLTFCFESFNPWQIEFKTEEGHLATYYTYAIAQTNCGGGDAGPAKFTYYISDISTVTCPCGIDERTIKKQFYDKLMNDYPDYANCKFHGESVATEYRKSGIRVIPVNTYSEASKSREEWIAYYKNKEVKLIQFSFASECGHCK